MKTLAKKDVVTPDFEKLVLEGDLSQLTVPQRLEVYNRLCEFHGLSTFPPPFMFLKDKRSGKLTLYATRLAAEQLRARRNISLAVVEEGYTHTTVPVDPQEPESGTKEVPETYFVKVRAKDLNSGREDDDQGVVSVMGLRGDDLANARMKATTKAKRRATLSICGVGLPDETEVDSIRGAERVPLERALPPSDEPASPETLQKFEDAVLSAGTSMATILHHYGAERVLDLSEADAQDAINKLRTNQNAKR